MDELTCAEDRARCAGCHWSDGVGCRLSAALGLAVGEPRAAVPAGQSRMLAFA